MRSTFLIDPDGKLGARMARREGARATPQAVLERLPAP